MKGIVYTADWSVAVRMCKGEMHLKKFPGI